MALLLELLDLDPALAVYVGGDLEEATAPLIVAVW